MRSARDRQGRFVSTSTPPEQVDEPTKPSKMTDKEFEKALREANSKPGVLDYLKLYASCQASQEQAIQAGCDAVYNRQRELRAVIDVRDDGVKSINLVDADNNFLALIRFRNGSPIGETKGVMEIFLHRTSSEPEIITINAENKLGPRSDGGLYDHVHWIKDGATSK